MKKLISFLMAMVLCFSLTACGGPDKQAAIEAHNRAGAAVNELVDIINADPESYAPYLEEMARLTDLLNQCGQALEKNDLEQAALDEWEETCNEIEQWAIDAKAELEG